MSEWVVPVTAAIMAALGTPLVAYRLGGRGKARLDDQLFYQKLVGDQNAKIATLEGKVATLEQKVEMHATEKREWISELDKLRDEYARAVTRATERAELAEHARDAAIRENARLTRMLGTLAEGVEGGGGT